MPKSAPFVTGQMLGCFQIVELLTDANRARDRRYRVHTLCCDLEMERSGHALTESERGNKQLCVHCANTTGIKTQTKDSPLFQPGETVGSVRITGLGDLLGWREVRWKCCGKAELIKVARLHVMKHHEKQGHVGQCRACTDVDARRHVAQAKAARAWLPAGAMLPPGIVSAAVAWPRVGA